jgi:hypothetical protein
LVRLRRRAWKISFIPVEVTAASYEPLLCRTTAPG